SQQARLATLYLPLFGILQENVNRLNIKDTTPLTNSLSSSTVRDEPVPTSSLMTPHKSGSHIESSLHKDVFGVISGTVTPHASSTPNISVRHADSRCSLISTDSGSSLPERSNDKSQLSDKKEHFVRRHSTSMLRPISESEDKVLSTRAKRQTMDFSLLSAPSFSHLTTHSKNTEQQSNVAAALGGSLLRCDKLEQSEVKSLLMCFLHVLKSMSEDALFTYWNKASSGDLMDFFTLL
ncbi:dedicator of cytokinesis protein 9 isoform X1, partial [Tachysurus ichikawai]